MNLLNDHDLQLFQSVNFLLYKFHIKPIDPRALKFRKYLTLERSDMDLLSSMKINPMVMRNSIKKFLKTRLIAFKALQSYWVDHTGYICSHIRDLTMEEDKTQNTQYVPGMTGKRRLHNFLKRCKNLESLRVYVEKASPTLLGNIRYLHKLKSLHLILDGDQVWESPNMVRDLSNLRYICIKFKKSSENSSEEIIATFCKHLLKLKSLKKIELDLQELNHPGHTQALESVLQHIGNSNIDFTITLCLLKTMLNIDKISCILIKIDALVLQCHTTHGKLRSEQSRIVQQGHRVLHFVYEKAQEWDFEPAVQACSSLQTLWIESGQFPFPKTLKNLFIVLPDLSILEAKRSISYLISALNDVETLEKLILTVPSQESLDQIDKFKDLKCIRNSTKYELTVYFLRNSLMRQLNENILISLCSPITTTSSLKSLKLHFENSLLAPAESLQTALDSLPRQLEQFELVILAYSNRHPKVFELHFPFETLSQLSEFSLDLCYPLSTNAGNQFTQEFMKMKELEVMIVKGVCFWNISLNEQKIVEGLKQMTKIRDVQLSIGKKESFSLKDYYQMIQNEETETETETEGKNWHIKRFRNW